MGVRGPGAIPLHVHRQRASALKRLPRVPLGLSANAATAWRRCGAQAIQLGTLTEHDLTGLELLARTLASIAELEAQLAADGLVLQSDSGARKAHPGLAALNGARAQARNLLGDFGLLPSGREKLRTLPSSGSTLHKKPIAPWEV
jgi:P27 family predicted phage terminase small subunit